MKLRVTALVAGFRFAASQFPHPSGNFSRKMNRFGFFFFVTHCQNGLLWGINQLLKICIV
ncbi:hypothetical protein [Larkinella knui]|uniref:Uncharacterized protein n=1 Tax=Larkinella knui TaxID=2025310 RepID=A0A3P1CND2_9BACT|nr:hypothetical protein [Larkinella knui]RRB14795.1 hypothetical protein EHT87_09500 [Larkinella knui]